MVKRPKSLSSRLTRWFAVAFIAFLILSFLFSYLAMNALLNQEIEEDLLEDVEELQNMFVNNGLQSVIEEIERESLSGETDIEFLLIADSEGRPVFSSDLSQWQGLATEPQLVQQLEAENEPILMDLHLESQEYKTKSVLARLDSDHLIFLGESTEENQDVMELLLIIFAAMLLVTIPVTALVVGVLSKKAVAGITEVSRAAIDIKQGKLDRRADVSSADGEIQQLADTFNSMADRIRGLIAEMREMIDNIAHDLRSPIARIRAISESTLASSDTLSKQDYQASVMDTLEECDRLINLINTTLDVAEVEANISNPQMLQIDFSDLVTDACELFEPLAEEKQIQYTCDISPGCRVYGNQHNLQRMVINLIDNAVKYTQHQGKIHVQLSNNDNKINCRISDDGLGIPESELDKVFHRFYRSDLSRGQQGCGLGLSFARAVARVHNGQITVISKPHAGSTFTLTLPGI